MPLTLRWRGATTLPVQAEAIRPDRLRELTAAQIGELPLGVGNNWAELGELFEMAGSAAEDETVAVEGDLIHLRNVGREMTAGRLMVRGDVGPCLGVGMTGGTIELDGFADSWAGAEMSGGQLRIRGGAGDYLGAPLPGGRRGVREGLILVWGSVGNYAGLAMRRGLIAVRGSVGDAAGLGMIAGSIFVFGPLGHPVGAGMKRGSIVHLDPEGSRAEPLPTFQDAGTYRAPWIEFYLRRLEAMGMTSAPLAFGRSWRRYNGDTLVGGIGELLEADI